MYRWSPRSPILAAAFTATLLVFAAMAPGVSAGVVVPIEGRPANIAWPQLDPAMQDTLDTIADQRGISREEARKRVGWQNAFALATTAIEEKYPDAYSRSETTSEFPAEAVIYFKGTIPIGVVAMLRTVPREVEIYVEGGREFTSNEIDDRVMQAAETAKQTGLIHSPSTGFDYESGTVQVVGRPGVMADKIGDAKRIEAVLNSKGPKSTSFSLKQWPLGFTLTGMVAATFPEPSDFPVDIALARSMFARSRQV